MERQRVRLCRLDVWETDGPRPARTGTVGRMGIPAADENMQHQWSGQDPGRQLAIIDHDGRRHGTMKLLARCPIMVDGIAHARWCATR